MLEWELLVASECCQPENLIIYPLSWAAKCEIEMQTSRPECHGNACGKGQFVATKFSGASVNMVFGKGYGGRQKRGLSKSQNAVKTRSRGKKRFLF